MKIPIGWFADYVDINTDLSTLIDKMTMSGSKVEGVFTRGDHLDCVVAGKIIRMKSHPDADTLFVCETDVGDSLLTVVTGAKNVKKGDMVPVAMIGAVILGKKIEKTNLRGIASEGMFLSIQELGLRQDEFLDADPDGIFQLSVDTVPGQEIKKVLGLDETVIEFEVTPNRPDCYSVIGLAKEMAAVLDQPFKKPSYDLKEQGKPINQDDVKITITDQDLCPRYSARIVEDVKIEPSPYWMRKRLVECGIRPINNIVDITNYVMLEYGQPMHAFDLDCLEDATIVVRRAKPGETLMTLDDQMRTLDPDALVIADAKQAIAVAGVMGGASTEITKDTRRILFESANFNKKSVRLTAKRLGLRTESSGLFEKGLDPNNTSVALDRAVQLVEQCSAGIVRKGITDVYVTKRKPKQIPLEPQKINDLLGTEISKEDMINILDRLHMPYDHITGSVTVPTFREDVAQMADLAEEVARFYGYNAIEATLLEGKSVTQGEYTFIQTVERKTKDLMVHCGFKEIYTYSFTSPQVFDMMNLTEDDVRREAVTLVNPLGEEFKVMRTTGLADLFRVLSNNDHRSIDKAALYEICAVYAPNRSGDHNQLPEQRNELTFGCYGDAYDFYDIKGVAETLFEGLNIGNVRFTRETNASEFHPGMTASVYVDRKKIGVIGRVHPHVLEKFELPRNTYAGVLDMNTLISCVNPEKTFTPLPRYPAVTRDLALVIDEDVPAGDIEQCIFQCAKDILEKITLFDVYHGKQVGQGKKSMAYSIVFRSNEGTLKDAVVNRAMDNILKVLDEKWSATLRS